MGDMYALCVCIGARGCMPMRKRRTRGSVADIRIVEGETQEGLVGASLQSLGDRKSDGRVRSRAGI